MYILIITEGNNFIFGGEGLTSYLSDFLNVFSLVAKDMQLNSYNFIQFHSVASYDIRRQFKDNEIPISMLHNPKFWN